MSNSPLQTIAISSPSIDAYDRVVVMANGEVESTHWVWHEVAMAIGVRYGSIPSAPDVGLRHEPLRNATSDNAQHVVEDELRFALRHLLERKDILIDRVVVPLPYRGAFEAWIQNLREPGSEPRKFAR